MASRRRPLFRQRRSFGQRLGSVAGIAAIVLAGFVAMAYVTLPWTSSIALRVFLNQKGWGPASLQVVRFDVHGIEIQNVDIGNHAATLTRAAVSYTVRDLLHRRVGDVTVSGLTVTAKLTADGLSIGPWHPSGTEPSPQSPEQPAPQTPTAQKESSSRLIPFRHLSIAGAKLILDLPQNPITTTLAVDLTPESDRWTGHVTTDATTPQGNDTATLLHADWQGVLAPAEPAKWPSKGTLDLNAAALALPGVNNTKLDAHGHLDLTTGNDQASVTTPDRLNIHVSALDSRIVSALPALWASRLANGMAIDAGGSKGGLALTWTTENSAVTAQADADLNISAGDTWLRAGLKGKTTGPAHAPPDTVALEELRLEANHVPLSLGEVSGRIRLSDVNGLLVVAQGAARVDVTIAKPALGPVHATSIALAGDTRFRVDGATLAFTPQTLTVTATDTSLPALLLPGPAVVTLADGGGDPQSLAVVFGSNKGPTLTFGLSTALNGVRLTPGSEGPAPLALDIPRLRVEGYVVPSSGIYDVTLNSADGFISNAIADLQLTQLGARFLPSGTVGNGEAQLVRFAGQTQQSARNNAGLSLKYNINKGDHLIEFSSSIRSSKSEKLGYIEGQFNAIDGSGFATLTTPHLVFGDGGIAAKDLFSDGANITNLTGTADLAFKTSWGVNGLTSSGHVNLNALGFQTPDLVLTGIGANLDLTSLWPLKAKGSQNIAVASLIAGLPFKDVSLDLSLPGDGTAVLTGASAAVAGGKASIAKIAIPMNGTQMAGFPLTLTHLNLGTFSAQANIDGLSATGNVSGSLPIRIENGVIWIDNGRIKSDAPGHIAYTPEKPPAALAGGGEIVLKALSNFQYEYISANISGDMLNDLKVGLAMKGKNPDLQNGYPIAFNLNLGGPLGNIMRQGVTSYHLTPQTIQDLQRNSTPATGVTNAPGAP